MNLHNSAHITSRDLSLRRSFQALSVSTQSPDQQFWLESLPRNFGNNRPRDPLLLLLLVLKRDAGRPREHAQRCLYFLLLFYWHQPKFAFSYRFIWFPGVPGGASRVPRFPWGQFSEGPGRFLESPEGPWKFRESRGKFEKVGESGEKYEQVRQSMKKRDCSREIATLKM